MNFETKKIQLNVSTERVSISDRMDLKFVNILIFLIITSSVTLFLLGPIGIVFSIIFSLGYVLFRYFAWLIWKVIEINPESQKLTVTHMVFNKRKRTKTLTNKFDYSDLTLREFEQSGMKRAMIQYKGHKNNDLLLLTYPEDIRIIKQWLTGAKTIRPSLQ